MALDHPLIHKQLIHVTDMEPRYQPYFNSNQPIYKVTVIPQKKPDSKEQLKTIVMIPANLRTGCLVVQNLGRYPIILPKNAIDDLRPLRFYVTGMGTQDVKVMNINNRQEYFIESMTFP